VDDDCCGRTCIRQVIGQRDIKLSDEDLRDRIQLFDREHRSPNGMLVAVSSGGSLGKYITLLSYSSGLSFASVYRILALLNLTPTPPSFSHILWSQS